MLTAEQWFKVFYSEKIMTLQSSENIFKYMEEYAAYVLEYNFQTQLIQIKK